MALDNIQNKDVELTQEQMDEYLKSECSICPICKSEDISGDHVQVDDGADKAYRDICCLACGSSWTETYSVTSIT